MPVSRFQSLLLVVVTACGGCSHESPSTTASPPTVVTQDSPPPPPDPTIAWTTRLDAAEAKLTSGELDEADRLLDELAADLEKLPEGLSKRFSRLGQDVEKAQIEKLQSFRAAAMEEAKKSLADGQLEAATRAADTVLNSGPTAEQRAEATALKVQVETQRRGRQKLQTAMRLMATATRADVRAAQEQLWNDTESAIPLLLEAVQSENPTLVANSLEMLRLLNQPQRSIPAMIGVLSRPSQSNSWPAALRELQKLEQAGAGEAVLELVQRAQVPEQRIAVLSALLVVVDPPQQSLVALLPFIFSDGPELPAALRAARHAVAVHHQQDLATRRGLDSMLTSEQESQLRQLPARLMALAATPRELSHSETARAALELAIATRVILAEALPNVQIARVTKAEPASPAANVLDQVWNSASADKLWRYPLGGQVSIVFDLGTERTVTGIRIWNYNEAGNRHRGWKEVEIFVDNRPALLSPIAEGLIAMAPGAADTADYGVTLEVPFVRGRYVKLQPRNYWREDSVSGLTEVQILGF